MKRFNRIISSLLILAVLGFSCSGPAEKIENEEEIAFTGQVIQVSQQQFEEDSMEIGEISMQNFEEVVTCNGYVTAPSNGMAEVSSPISGNIRSISCYIGDYVKKGQQLFVLESIELLKLQQEFSIAYSKLKRVKTDYERSKALYEENIGTEKEFIATESEYLSVQSTYQSLKIRLELLRLDVNKIEDGELYSTFPIYSPISGYITTQMVVIGQFIEPTDVMVEIVDVKQLQLKLSVFEKDVNQLKAGQTVVFKSMGEPDFTHVAKLTSVGKTINDESKTIQCLAKIEDETAVTLTNKSYIEARIEVGKVNAAALPTDAVVKSGKDYYVFVLEKKEDNNYFLKPEKVKLGKVSNGFTEIVNGPENEKIITAGAYNLRIE